MISVIFDSCLGADGVFHFRKYFLFYVDEAYF